MLRNPLPQPLQALQPRGGSTVRSVLELDVTDYCAAVGFDYPAFERATAEVIERLSSGTVIRLKVGGLMPPPDGWHQLPFGPQHQIEICGTDPEALAAWRRTLTDTTSTFGGVE